MVLLDYGKQLDPSCRHLILIHTHSLARWISAFIAGWFSLRLLHSKESQAYTETTTPAKAYSPSRVKPQVTKYAGRTMDLTLFAATRALDVIVGELWSRRRVRRQASNKWTKVCLI